ncbi:MULTISPECIES: Sir2 family NAD-dependent protein deacetylase [unclassified Pseudomonas]|jgi:hypothetical protein|uniref:Sir2 family NAD-dependent protein deacetylase n=1 Tax=unclassified Pseudomonas TaxID=196821 RepID=UPI00210C24B6|nr:MULTISPECIES: Sir2 family NAD-dependent protein deacetylase [unclassified Pseudomonas]
MSAPTLRGYGVFRLTAAGPFSGAGISAESGIPTFRDALTGLWENFDPAVLATAQVFRNDPPFTRCPANSAYLPAKIVMK